MTAEKKCEDLDRLVQEGATDETELMEAVATCLGEEIRRFAQARCGSARGDVEDISQDVLLAAQRYLSSFRGEASLRTWLYRLVLSACSRRRRGRKNDPKLHRPLDEVGALEPAHATDPEAELLVSERLVALQAAIGELRPEDRELLAAVEWQGQSLQEAGERFGLTVPAMKSRMFRIRQQLKELVAAKFDQHGEEPA